MGAKAPLQKVRKPLRVYLDEHTLSEPSRTSHSGQKLMRSPHDGESLLGRHRAEETPFIGHAFENVTAALFKRQS